MAHVWYNETMEGTVGSTSANLCNFEADAESSYILGLWLADGYHRTSSIGISTTDVELLIRFEKFLLKYLPRERLRLRGYVPTNEAFVLPEALQGLAGEVRFYRHQKARRIGWHLYVNYRPMARAFFRCRSQGLRFGDARTRWSYLAGRFDGDGCIAADGRHDCRIVYTTAAEAERDLRCLRALGFKRGNIYYYRTSNTFVLYISMVEAPRFVEGIAPYSSKMQKLKLQKFALVPRRDLISQSKGEIT